MSVGTFKREKLTKDFRPHGANGPVEKTFPDQPSQAAIESQVTNQDTSLAIKQLAASVERVRQTIAPDFGSHELTTAEKQKLRGQIITTMLGGNAAPPWFVSLVNVAVKLKADFDVPTPPASKSTRNNLEKAFGKVEVECPYCHAVAKTELSAGVMRAGLQKIQCASCSKSWSEDLSETGMLQKIHTGINQLEAAAAPAAARAASVKFQPLHTGERLSEVVGGVPARKAQDANAARRPEDVRKFFGPGSDNDDTSSRAGRFVPDGVEKSEQALELLKTSRANPKPFEPIS
jgi:hypothetical protein